MNVFCHKEQLIPNVNHMNISAIEGFWVYESFSARSYWIDSLRLHEIHQILKGTLNNSNCGRCWCHSLELWELVGLTCWHIPIVYFNSWITLPIFYCHNNHSVLLQNQFTLNSKSNDFALVKVIYPHLPNPDLFFNATTDQVSYSAIAIWKH